MSIVPKSTKKEKLFYSLGGVGSQFMWTFMAYYVLMYYTNSVGFSSALAGTMMLASRVFDGFTDVLFAWVMRKVHFKRGLATPWLLICAPLFLISIIAVFNVPENLGTTGIAAYIFLTYSLAGAISYTIYNLAISALLAVMTYDEVDRTRTSSLYFAIIYIAIIGMNYLTPWLATFYTDGYASSSFWTMISIIYGILACVLLLLAGLFVKEKQPPHFAAQEEADAKPAERPGFISVMKVLLKEKYTYILLIIFFIFAIISSLAGIQLYYWYYVVENPSLYSIFCTFTLVPSIIGLLLAPTLYKKFGRFRMVTIGMLFYMALGIVSWIGARNAMLVLVAALLMGFGQSLLTGTIYVWIGDYSDYIIEKHDVLCAESISMTNSVGTKIGTGLGTAAVGWGLALVGYDATLETQSMATQNGIIFLMFGLGVICEVILLILIRLWARVEKEPEMKAVRAGK